MTTQPRLTAEEAEVQQLLEHIDDCLRRGSEDFLANREVATLAAALRKRDELADAYWLECEYARKKYQTSLPDKGYCVVMRNTDAARRAAGLGEV